MASPARKLRHLARVLSGERKITAATRRALEVLLTEAARALAASGYSTDVLDNRLPGWRAAIDKDVVPTIEAAFSDAFAAAGRGVVDPAPYATRHIESVHNRLVNVSDDVFDSMRLTLEEGRRAGEGIALLAGRVDALLSDDERWNGRARTIARTEVVSANNAGAALSAKATADVLGVEQGEVIKEWLATMDSRTRETHAEADGQQVFGLDTPFNVGGEDLQEPGDPAGSAAEVVSCRCTALYIYPGDPEYASAAGGTPFAGRETVSEARFVEPTTTLPATPAPVLAPASIEAPVDSGPSNDMERMARALTIPELQAEARRTRGSRDAVKVAKAELRRRGIAASAAPTAYLTEDEVRAGNVGPLVVVAPDGTHQTLDQFVNQEDDVTTTAPEAEAPTTPLAEPTHAGLAVWAADTERVLMLQRSLDPEDAPDVQGTWEFPGGGIEEGEDAQTAAYREFTEETGLPIPDGEVTNGWRSDDGVYQGFVLTVPAEAGAFGELNPDLAAAEAVNPDDPQRRNPDVTAWFTLDQVQGLGTALRPEVHHTPWDVFDQPAPPQEAPMDPQTPDPALEAALAVVRTAGFAVQLAEEPAMVDAPMNPEDAPTSADAIDPDGEPFYGIAAPEDVLSGDGRLFAEGALTWRDLPLPLMCQDAQAPGHDGAVRVGRLDVLERDTSGAKPMIRYAGVWDTSPVAQEAKRQVEAKVARGVSVDCDAVTVEVVGSDGGVLDPMVDEFPEDGVVNERATAARISGLTICSIPAFHQAYIANGTLAERTEAEPGATELMEMPVDPTAEPAPEDAVAVAASAGSLLTYRQVLARQGRTPEPAWSLTAGATFPTLVQPAAAFTRPACLDDYETGYPMTVTEDGRVYGHLAVWGTCHIGVNGLCQEPPASASNYAHFYGGGRVPTDDGAWVSTGPLVMGTGHAGLKLGHRAAAAHYDNTGTCTADVVMGQDHIGIWFAGTLRPGTTPEQVYAMRAAGKVSGDWRNIGGSLDLVAALVVNCPGFPIPNPAITASAEHGAEAMVAAGMVQTVRPPETHDVITAAANAAVAAALDRRDRATSAWSRLNSQRASVRRRRVAAASARIIERV
jgi:8-oxo-dGTP pyrophosphatase MutT (NUDIX family)